MEKPQVILRSCPEYDTDAIAGIIEESARDLGMVFNGKAFIKPNVVTANKNYIHDSFTHPSVVGAMVRVLKKQGAQTITIGESGGFGIPTRLFLKESGYFDMAKQSGADLIDLNEHALERVSLKKGRWHKSILLSKYIKEADVKIWMPKLKFHIFACITNVLKLNVGILAHKERMLYHDHRIHEKIVDLLEPGYPDFIVTDAVKITYGFESAPYPVPLGALIFSNHPLSVDAVAAHIMGYDPKDVLHLKIAADRGYGSLDLLDMDISGDVEIEALKNRPKGKTRLFQVLSELDTPIEFYRGHAPDTETICDGGCEGALKGCLGTIEKKYPGSLKKAKKGAIVTGIYHGDVIMPDGPVLLVGDCTEVTGRLEAQKVIYAKACPMGARNLFLKVPGIFNLPSPMTDIRDASLFIWNSLIKGFFVLWYRYLLKR